VLGGRRDVKHAVSHMPSCDICNIILGRHNVMYVKRPGSNGPRYMFVLRGDTRAHIAPQLVTVCYRMHASVVHYNARAGNRCTCFG
jgi:hypothetical protein